ncbi:tumor necrosis factor receptor superfamily member 9 isoform X1 [Mus caroli]|uniref:Tumor necrosis factor receptor superfamily member 9 isoform X1 n=1 Tax=Mus caroli TaxID=10089 RepID=A0A6P5PGM4_MUSCR|nr:tumor necrosis factor receptor superfamily member 9 isoform X1 [Mus caroli]XP_021016812.1 tumor necrosis factor receptor superfamily member 9 isoform X1 [Mus caroli]
MGNNCYNVVVTVLLLVGSEKVGAVQNSCDNCQPGTFCRKYNPVCKKCPSSTFSSRGGQPSCDICRVCEGYFRLKKSCSSTHNTECECTEGFHCLGPQCTRCEKDCRPGQQLTEQGCKNCSLGTFNDQNGAGVCRPWTNCSLDGRSVLKIGTTEKDVVCGPPVVSFSPGTTTSVTAPEGEPGGRSLQVLTLFLALTSTLLLVLIFITLLFSVPKWIGKKFPHIFKQPFKKAIGAAQEEDACSCRFPEEEEGGGGGYEL